MRLVGELARRKVLKVGAAYLATAWVLLQLTDIVAPALSLPGWTLRLVMLLAIGFPMALLLAWQFNLTADGLAAEAATAFAPRTRKRDWLLPGAVALAWLGNADGALAAVQHEVAAGWVCERYLLETGAGMPDPLVEPLRGRAAFLDLMAQVRLRNAAAFAALQASGKPLLPEAAEPLAGR